MKTPPALRQSRRFIYITGEFTANCIEVLRGKPWMVYERVEQDFLRHPELDGDRPHGTRVFQGFPRCQPPE